MSDEVVDNVEEVIPQEAFDSVDLTVPLEYEVEVVAANMVNYLSEYRAAIIGLRAAKQNGDHERQSALAKAEAFYRNAVAYIQYKYPDAKAISDQIMKAQAKNTATNRAKMTK